MRGEKGAVRVHHVDQISVADPAFGQGGLKNFPGFVHIKYNSSVTEANKYQGPGPP